MSVGGVTQAKQLCTYRCTAPPTPAAHLCVAPCALLYQAPRHGAAHGEALEDAPDEVTQAEGHQLLEGGVQMSGDLPGSAWSLCRCV